MGIHLPGFGTAALKQAGREVCDKLKILKKERYFIFFLMKSVKPGLSEQSVPLAGDLGVISAVRDLYCFHPAHQGWSSPCVDGWRRDSSGEGTKHQAGIWE